MADDDELASLEGGEDTMLKEAIGALRLGDRKRAKELLTSLLKVDQNNAQYWIWLSVAVDTQKERVYCLQTAHQIDPENVAAKRGLIILGGLPPDESTPPFPVNRPRLWEEKIVVPKQPQEKLRGWSNPVARVFMIIGIAILVLGVAAAGYLLIPKGARPVLRSTSTHRPTATITPTPTNTVPPNLRTPTPTFLGPTPLYMFLQKTYTPTPLYVITQHPITSRSAFEAGLRFLAARDYANALVLFKQAQSLEPKAPDFDYYIGEVYRAEGQFRNARDSYQKAINMDSYFAPAFLGRALANLGISPNSDVIKDLNQAIDLDPNYADAYLQRAQYELDSNPTGAISDLNVALELEPYSAIAYLYLADAQLSLGENEAALVSAQRANQLDLTLVPAYLALARAYIATGHGETAVSVLQTYTVYEPADTSAFLTLGTAYNAAGDYQLAISILTRAIDADRKDAEAYYQRGFAYMNLQKPTPAEADLRSAVAYNPTDFDAQLVLGRVLDMQKKPGDAYMQIDQKAYPLAKTNVAKAQVYYWEGTILEEINDPLSKQGAVNAWTQLLSLPPDVMPPEWHMTAMTHLHITPTATLTPVPTQIPSYTPTPTLAPTSSSTSTPSRTQTPTSP